MPSSRAGRAAAYTATALAALYAAVSLYWTLGGRALLSTVGGQIADLALNGGAAAIALGATTVVVKLLGVPVALAVAHPPQSRVLARLGRALAAVGGVVLIAYGGTLVVAGALVLLGAITPGGGVDETALRWHVFVWDLWFLAWGVALALAVWLTRASRATRR